MYDNGHASDDVSTFSFETKNRVTYVAVVVSGLNHWFLFMSWLLINLALDSRLY